MPILIPLGIGVVIGGVLKWQIDRRINTKKDETLAEELATLKAELNRLKSDNSKVSGELAQIKGIGPFFAKKLNEAGIDTISELANSSPEAIIAIIAPEKGTSLADPKDWIKQAQALKSV